MLGQKKQSGRWDTLAACCSTTVSVETKNASQRQACRPVVKSWRIPSPCLACSSAPHLLPGPPSHHPPATLPPGAAPACRHRRWHAGGARTLRWLLPGLRRPASPRVQGGAGDAARQVRGPAAPPVCPPRSVVALLAACAGHVEHLTARPTQGSGGGREQGCRGPGPCHLGARAPSANLWLVTAATCKPFQVYLGCCGLFLPRRECYGIVDVFPDALHIRGVDTFASEVWPLQPLPQHPAARRGEAAREPAAAAVQP
jgi:hypothetical protein